ncbi:MAG: pyridoxamine 5'-phosphate oxidase family protein [Candidatus Adiutrix sp.]|jgi:nitroimidazol reductase NimA-like FMN-containing flavoprotein (pyridoxamine 5'-phosphate oxidase superfamily)|nr:pyridoxamine 5'-phosphate oxidase family protein [Candidatus Adiutrix sp.]
MRKAHAWNDEAALDDFLHNMEIGHLTTIDAEGWPLTVPLNYVWHGGNIFFHTGPGEKMANLRANPKVSFTVTEALGLLTSDFTNAPCHDTQLGRSVFIRGLAHEIAEPERKQRILGKIIAKYDPKFAAASGDDENFSPESIMEQPSFQACQVVEIVAASLSGRRHLLSDKPEKYRKAVAAHFQRLGQETGRERDLATARLIFQNLDII